MEILFINGSLLLGNQHLYGQSAGSGGTSKGGSTKSTGKSQAEKDSEAGAKYLETLRQQVDQVKEMSTYQKLIYDMQAGAVKFVSPGQAGEAERLAIIADFQKSGAELLEQQNKLREQGIALTEQTLTPMEKLRKEQEQINELLAGGYVTPETANRALGQAQASAFGMQGGVNQYITGDVSPLSGGAFDDQAARYEAEAEAEQKRYADQLARLQESLLGQQIARSDAYTLQEQLAQIHADRMSQIDQAQYSMAFGTAEQGFASLAETMATAQGETSAAYQAMFAVSKAFGIAQATIGLSNAISSAMALPWPANLAAAASAAGYMATIISNVQSVTATFSDGGYVADGTGGFTGPGGKYTPAGIVHAGEYVINKEATSHLGLDYLNSLNRGYASGGYVGSVPAMQPGYQKYYENTRPETIVQVNEDASKAGTTERSISEQGDEIIKVFVSNIRKGGLAAQALESTYGSKRKGR